MNKVLRPYVSTDAYVSPCWDHINDSTRQRLTSPNVAGGDTATLMDSMLWSAPESMGTRLKRFIDGRKMAVRMSGPLDAQGHGCPWREPTSDCSGAGLGNYCVLRRGRARRARYRPRGRCWGWRSHTVHRGEEDIGIPLHKGVRCERERSRTGDLACGTCTRFGVSTTLPLGS